MVILTSSTCYGDDRPFYTRTYMTRFLFTSILTPCCCEFNDINLTASSGRRAWQANSSKPFLTTCDKEWITQSRRAPFFRLLSEIKSTTPVTPLVPVSSAVWQRQKISQWINWKGMMGGCLSLPFCMLLLHLWERGERELMQQFVFPRRWEAHRCYSDFNDLIHLTADIVVLSRQVEG